MTNVSKETRAMLEANFVINHITVSYTHLNGLGSEFFDGFWLTITVQEYWTPYFLLIFYFLAKKIGWKNFLIALVFIAFLILVSDQTSNLFKNHFQRLRPCNDLDLKNIIRIVKPSDSYSFFSGHATNSMATTVFVFLIIRRYYKYALLLFLFPLIFAFSRIYPVSYTHLDVYKRQTRWFGNANYR